MATIHFLNVKQGDCSIIQHNSDRVTVIDVCNAKTIVPQRHDLRSDSDDGWGGSSHAASSSVIDFQQKKHPVNPIKYMHDRDIDCKGIFRYIQTHPDMDHMDGIKSLFAAAEPLNLWDTENTKTISDDAWVNSPYQKEDWMFYKNMRNKNLRHAPKRLALLSGDRGQFFNVGVGRDYKYEDEGGKGDSDGLHILAPTQKLVDDANKTEEYNDCSYVILYCVAGNRIVFAGDSHDKTWEHILRAHEKKVTDIDLLIAPHHGRDSNRSYDFLDILNPKSTFFGNTPSKHLAYDVWRKRKLAKITNNQADCMVVDASLSPMHLYVTNKKFAANVNTATYYDDEKKAWFVSSISDKLRL